MLTQHLLGQQVMELSCVAMFVAFPSAILEATTAELAPEGACIILDAKVANTAIQLIPIAC